MDHGKSPPHITVCICTFRRPAMLQRLLGELEQQKTEGEFTYSVVVADNDADGSASNVVKEFASASKLSIRYCCEPRANIALARNKALENAEGDFIAFIDDDEFPTFDWLLRLFTACNTYSASGVLGPVRPHFERPPEKWIIDGRFCERPEYPTGRSMRWTECRTGNLLFKRELIAGETEPFDPKFGNGGEDMDFFRRKSESGSIFVWCNEAVAMETVPPERLSRSFMLKRALLRGKNILKHSSGSARFVATSLLATPVYLLLLPITLLFGHHCFMKFAIKLCDHSGRLLAIARLNPVSKR